MFPLTVQLQENLSFHWLWLFIALLFLLAAIYYLYHAIKYDREKKDIIPIHLPPKRTIRQIKEKYIEKINDLENDLQQNKLQPRIAYQKLSVLARLFTYEMTGIQSQNYTLEELRTVPLPKLIPLIEEYYTPEFAREELGDVLTSLQKTKEVISSW